MGSRAPWGPKKGIKKEPILSKNDVFWWLANITWKYVLLGHFWKYKPPQGAAGDKSRVFGNPEFGKKSSLKTVWLNSFNDFLKSGSKLLAVALTFQGGSFEHGNEIYWMWVIKRHVTFCWPHGNIAKIRRNIMFLRFCKVRCRENKEGWVP